MWLGYCWIKAPHLTVFVQRGTDKALPAHNIISISYELMTWIEMRHFLMKWYFPSFFGQAQICQVISISWIAAYPSGKMVLNSSSYCSCNSLSALLCFFVFVSSSGIYFSLSLSLSTFLRIWSRKCQSINEVPLTFLEIFTFCFPVFPF